MSTLRAPGPAILETFIEVDSSYFAKEVVEELNQAYIVI
jgi:hypothetical protein